MTDERPWILSDARFLEHEGPPGHPERPARLLALDAGLEQLGARVKRLAPRRATDEEILRVHAHEHLAKLDALSGKRAQLDPDTFAGPRSSEVARLAAGGTTRLALAIAQGEARRGLALIRPPGHHAERERAMGFCLLNQVAIAARALQAEGLERIAVIDWDVHHGNGTQHVFERERDVLFVSTHQFPFYPGTGALDERGEGPGTGSTVNLPLPAGCGDTEYLAVFDALVVPIVDAFRPELVLVSAGFDAHAADPLGGMRVSSSGFAGLARRVRALADRHANGRLLLALEGGYDEQALAASVASVCDVLLDDSAARDRPARVDHDPPADPRGGAPSTDRPPAAGHASRVAAELVRVFRDAHGSAWPAAQGG